MSLFTARMKKIQSKMKALACSQQFCHCKSMGIFFRHSRTANSAMHGPSRLNFELRPDFLVVLLTCKNEDDSTKNEGAIVFTTL